MTVEELKQLLFGYDEDMEIKYSSSSEGIQMDISSVDVEKDMYGKEDIIVIKE